MSISSINSQEKEIRSFYYSKKLLQVFHITLDTWKK